MRTKLVFDGTVERTVKMEKKTEIPSMNFGNQMNQFMAIQGQFYIVSVALLTVTFVFMCALEKLAGGTMEELDIEPEDPIWTKAREQFHATIDSNKDVLEFPAFKDGMKHQVDQYFDLFKFIITNESLNELIKSIDESFDVTSQTKQLSIDQIGNLIRKILPWIGTIGSVLGMEDTKD